MSETNHPDRRGRLRCRAEALPRRLRLRHRRRPHDRRPRRRRGCGGRTARRAYGTGRDPHQGAGPDRQGRRQALRAGEVEARREPIRRPQPPDPGGRRRQAAEARGQFPLALPRDVLGRAEPGLIHVPAADPERDPAPLAVRRRRRPRRPARRRLRPRHHPGEPAGPRDQPRARPALPRRAHRYRPDRSGARAPTTSATSPARPRPASTPRSCWTRARLPSPGTTGS